MEPAITATLYCGHLHIATTFNMSLQDLSHCNLPVYNSHLYITAIIDQSLGGLLLAGSIVYLFGVVNLANPNSVLDNLDCTSMIYSSVIAYMNEV